eukprot:UN33641
MQQIRKIWNMGMPQVARLMAQGYASIELKLRPETDFINSILTNEDINWKSPKDLTAYNIKLENDRRAKTFNWTGCDGETRAALYFEEPCRYSNAETYYYITAAFKKTLINSLPSIFRLQNPIQHILALTPGVTSPYIYTGQIGCTFLSHLEDYRFYHLIGYYKAIQRFGYL